MNQNLYELPGVPVAEELVTVLAENSQVRIERIVSTGQTSGWYNQDQAEFVALLTGAAELEFADGQRVTMAAGDTLTIAPHQIHRVAFTSMQPPCVWLCVFYAEPLFLGPD